jgi:hypothetical protein
MPTIAELRAKEQAVRNIPITDMTLRDWFAGQALLGFAMRDDLVEEATALMAYKRADAMMKARTK